MPSPWRKETKIASDLWEISYAVTKRRVDIPGRSGSAKAGLSAQTIAGMLFE
ncbi:MAG TPA: hypothetical protein VN824_11870 [Puia sp.]|nr:hypothetical protein [Puia sp.]